MVRAGIAVYGYYPSVVARQVPLKSRRCNSFLRLPGATTSCWAGVGHGVITVPLAPRKLPGSGGVAGDGYHYGRCWVVARTSDCGSCLHRSWVECRWTRITVDVTDLEPIRPRSRLSSSVFRWGRASMRTNWAGRREPSATLLLSPVCCPVLRRVRGDAVALLRKGWSGLHASTKRA